MRRSGTRLVTALSILPMLLLAAHAQGQTAEPDLDLVVQVRLIDGWPMQNGNHMGALEVTLAPGWKTFWRKAGDAGIAPRFDWGKSVNLENVRLHWPRPGIFKSYGLRILGFRDQLVLPIEFSPKDPAKPIDARLHLRLGVCKEVCIPVDIPLVATARAKAQGRGGFLIEKALDMQPETATAAGLTSAICHLEKTAGGYRLYGRFRVSKSGTGAEMVVFELPQKNIRVAALSSRRVGNVLSAKALLVSLAGPMPRPRIPDLRITLIGENRAIYLKGCTQG